MSLIKDPNIGFNVDMSPFTVYSHYMTKGANSVDSMYDPGTNTRAWLDPRSPAVMATTVPTVKGVPETKRTIFAAKGDDRKRDMVNKIFAYQEGLETDYPWESSKAQETRNGIASSFRHITDEFRHFQSTVHKHNDHEIPTGDIAFATASDPHVGMDEGEQGVSTNIQTRLFRMLYSTMNFLGANKIDFIILTIVVGLLFLLAVK